MRSALLAQMRPYAQRLTGLGEQPGAVGAAVVRQEPFDHHAQRPIVRHCGLEELDHGFLALVSVHLHVAGS